MSRLAPLSRPTWQGVIALATVLVCALWWWPAVGQDVVPRPDGDLLFKATFEEGTDGFAPAYGSEWMEFGTNGGAAEVRALAADTAVVAVLPGATFGDFAVEVDIRPLTQRTGEDFGLFFRSASLEDDLSRYYAASFVPAEGKAYLDIWQDATEWTTLAEAEIPEGVLDADGFNRLRLEAVGDQFTVFLNEVFLLRGEDGTISEPGIIGMFVSAAEKLPEGEQASAQFDDLSVYALGVPKTARQTKPAVSAGSSPAGRSDQNPSLAEPATAPTETPAERQPPAGLPFYDDFSAPNSGWQIMDEDTGSISFRDGELIIRDDVSDDSPASVTPGIVADDVVIEVQSRLAGGTDDNWQIIFCRRTGTSDYAFAYRTDGYFAANTWVDDEIVRQVDVTETAAIRQGSDAVNTVKVSCVGTRQQFWINGTLLVDWDDDRLQQGEFGLAAQAMGGGYTEVAFDNFVATGTVAPESAGTAESAPAAGTPDLAATVTAPNLNVRAGPGADYTRLDSVAQDEILAVTGRNAACSWLQVTTPRTEGWVSAGYVRLSVPCDDIPVVGQEETPVAGEAPAGGTVVTVEPTTTAGTNLVTDFESFGNWRRGDETWGTFTQSGEEAYGGTSSGRIAYDFPANVPGDRNYVVFLRSLPIPGRPDALQMQVYGDGAGNFLNVWVKDAAGQIWQFTFGQVKHIGWKPMVAALDTGGKWPVQLISGDGKPLQYPLKLEALVLDYPTAAAASGDIYVDDMIGVTN
jgi:uncharacterized protein YraI